MSKYFDEDLIKGKIAEAIFEQMFRDQEEFDVVQNGYEYKNPELAQNLFKLEHPEFLKKYRHAPDFVLISKNKDQAFLVEVKYRKEINKNDLLKIATELHDDYGPCYLFIATPQKFFFDSCSKIINEETIGELGSSWIPESTRDKFLSLLNKFIIQKS